MPELPEVEITVRHLREHWLGRTIREVVVTETGASQINLPVRSLKESLENASLVSLTRYGKWMLFNFQNGNSTNVVGHLRMSGSYLISDTSNTHPHKRLEFILDNGKFITYIDQRRFGTWHLVDDTSQYLNAKNLGPDALSDDFNAEYLLDRLKNSLKPIYSSLLDQSVVAGLGNIYVNEALAASYIHPFSKSNKVPYEVLTILVENTKKLLRLSLEMKGTTLLDNLYNTPEGKSGEFAQMLKVYGHKKDVEVTVTKIGGRSVFYKSNQVLFT